MTSSNSVSPSAREACASPSPLAPAAVATEARETSVTAVLPRPLSRLDAGDPVPGIDPLLLTCTRISTFLGDGGLTSATGFFLAREERLFVVTSRHVFIDKDANHFPDRITIEVHSNREDLGMSTTVSIALYHEGLSRWHQAVDSAGEVDVALIEVERSALPVDAVYCAFTPAHMDLTGQFIEVGAPLLVIGFPLGFHDALHHMPVVRRASLASSFGLRFQGLGCFLTDARTHRGTSGAPVVIRVPTAPGAAPGISCRLLGVHSSRFDAVRDPLEDEALGLNCAWYSDILLTLSED